MVSQAGCGPVGGSLVRWLPTDPRLARNPERCQNELMREQAYAAQTSIIINAPRARVWEALVNPTLVREYLHGTTMEAEWREGGDITWSGEWNGQTYQDKGVVLRFEPMSLISTTHWSPLSGSADTPENYHVVTYTLTDDGDQTNLTLTQSNSPSQQDADSMVEQGWKPILQTLKQVVERSRKEEGAD